MDLLNLLGILGLLSFVIAVLKLVPKKKDTFMGIGAVLGVIWFLGSYGFIAGLAATGPVGGTTQTTVATDVTKTCTGINTINLYVASKNPLNNTLQYQAGTYYVVNSGGSVPIASGTGTYGSTLTYTAINTVPCTLENFDGMVYAVGTAALSSGVAPYHVQGTAANVIVEQPNSNVLTLVLRDTTLVNTSISATTTGTETTAVAMSSGDTRNFYLDVSQATGKSQYGSTHDGILWCVDTVDQAAFSDNAISISVSSAPSGWKFAEVPCSNYPQTVSADSCNRCYKSDRIKATDGIVRISGSMTNDLGTDAGASSDPVLYIEDIVYAQDTNGNIILNTHDAGGTNLGESQNSFTFANS